MHYFVSILVCNHLEKEEKTVCFAIIVLSYICIVTKKFSGSSSRCLGLVCSVLLWYFLVILTSIHTADNTFLVTTAKVYVIFPMPVVGLPQWPKK